MHQHIRPLQSPALLLSNIRKQAEVRGKEQKLSAQFVRTAGYSIGVLLLLVLLLSQFFFWRISQEKEKLARMQAVHETIRQQEAEVRAERDRLIAKPRIMALAAAELNLHVPEKKQEHYLY